MVGVFRQPIKYERNCQQCHTLQILPDLPTLRIPHGDPEKVRWFLASLRIPIENALRDEGVSAPQELAKRTKSELDALYRRGLRTQEELEERVFFQGDPKVNPDERRMRAGNPKFLTECAKCHTVAPGSTERAPQVTLPNMAANWLLKGPFTHRPHQHMACVDCHGAALTSKLTSDILLPTRRSCTDCHRPASGLGASKDVALAKTQRESGGIKWDCQSCHRFHAPPDAQSAAKEARP